MGSGTIPTGIAGGGDIPGPSLSSLWRVWEVGSSAIVWVGFQQRRVKGIDAQSVKSRSHEKTPEREGRGAAEEDPFPTPPNPQPGPLGWGTPETELNI